MTFFYPRCHWKLPCGSCMGVFPGWGASEWQSLWSCWVLSWIPPAGSLFALEIAEGSPKNLNAYPNQLNQCLFSKETDPGLKGVLQSSAFFNLAQAKLAQKWGRALMKAVGLTSLCISWSWKSNWAMIQCWESMDSMRHDGGKTGQPSSKNRAEKMHFNPLLGDLRVYLPHQFHLPCFRLDRLSSWPRQDLRNVRKPDETQGQCKVWHGCLWSWISSPERGSELWMHVCVYPCAKGGWHCWGQPRCHPPCPCLCPRPNLDPSLT